MEGVTILARHAPRGFLVEDGQLRGVEVGLLEWDEAAVTGTVVETVVLAAADLLLAVGQEAAFDWTEPGLGIDLGPRGLPVVGPATMAASRPGVFVGGDAALGPRNIVSAVADGHVAAGAIDRYCRGLPPHDAPGEPAPPRQPPNGAPAAERRERRERRRPPADARGAAGAAVRPARRGGGARVLGGPGVPRGGAVPQLRHPDGLRPPTVHRVRRLRERLPAECLTITEPGTAEEVCARLTRPGADPDQPLYVSPPLPQTGRPMVKDESVCLHCGLCAERCPVAAWDMAKVDLTDLVAKAAARMAG